MNTAASNRFSWNSSALAGSALGASLWMPASALASGWQAIGLAAAFSAAFLILASAFFVWRSRQRLSAFTGLMVLLAVGFVATALFFATAQALDLSMLDRWPGGKHVSSRSYAWILLFYPAFAGWFWLHKRNRNVNLFLAALILLCAGTVYSDSNSQADVSTSKAVRRVNKADDELVHRLVQIARDRYETGNLKAADKILQAALEIEPRNNEAWYYKDLLQQAIRANKDRNIVRPWYPTLPPRPVHE